MNRKVRNLLASVVFGVCLLALSFIPSFAANSANPASVDNPGGNHKRICTGIENN